MKACPTIQVIQAVQGYGNCLPLGKVNSKLAPCKNASISSTIKYLHITI